ncbi:hypothetical protein PB1_15869 [Bacillus methanolicus PB1]|uniref:G5 domain-containing protein n=1 Tax=Bacillus methanolicus PB1 TaxID=997296 RepID=I3DXS9_BACMT|nr:VanW family protein [Bacillus methanolicus]EIJ79050.1 hypothetical protein PB1_15869 [Bacillus methanolicus PB1]
MRKPQAAKLFLVLIFCTAFLFSFSHFGAAAFDKFVSNKDVYEKNTRISEIDISGLSKAEALNLVMEKQKEWSENTTVTFHYKETATKMDLDYFLFDLKKSIDTVENGKANQLVVKVDEERLLAFIEEFTLQEIHTDTFDFDRFIQDLVIFASMLEAGEHSINIDEYLLAGEEKEVISETTIKADGNLEYLQKWTEQFPSIEIVPQSQFSILKTIKESNAESFPSEALSMIATAIYKTVLPTNFAITERHIGRELPSYIDAGYEAKINRNKNMDLVFTNPNSEKYLLEFKMINDLFYVSLKGTTFAYQYKVKTEDKQTFKPKTIIQYSAQLPFGKIITIDKRKEGILVKVFRETADKNGNRLKKELLSEDFYPPVPIVIRRSLIEKDSSINEKENNFADEKSGQSTETPAASNPETADKKKEPSIPENGSREEPSNQTDHETKQESDLWGKPNEMVK